MTDPLFPHSCATQTELNLLRRPEPISAERRASLLRVLREPLSPEAATLVLTMTAADLSAAMVALRGEAGAATAAEVGLVEFVGQKGKARRDGLALPAVSVKPGCERPLAPRRICTAASRPSTYFSP